MVVDAKHLPTSQTLSIVNQLFIPTKAELRSSRTEAQLPSRSAPNDAPATGTANAAMNLAMDKQLLECIEYMALGPLVSVGLQAPKVEVISGHVHIKRSTIFIELEYSEKLLIDHIYREGICYYAGLHARTLD